MSLESKQKGIYPGWWIVVTSLFLMSIIFAGIISLPGVFTIFVTADFGVTRTAFTTHMMICTLTSMVAALFVGKVFQKLNIKGLMTVFTIIAAASFLGYSFAAQLWHFYAISAVMGFCMMFLTSVPISILINNWFGPKMKGRAMGIAMTGSGIGAMILSPVLTTINTVYSWRLSYRLLALLVVVLVLPLVVLTISKSPADKGIARLGDVETSAFSTADAVSGLSVKQALGTGLFWLMFFTFFLFALTTQAFNSNAIPYLTDIGIDPARAGFYMSVWSIGVIVGKLLLGWICDKKNAKFASSCAIIALMAGLAILISAQHMLALALIGMFVFGMGAANATVNMPLITNDLMGARDFGAIFGYANIASSLGVGVGPLAAALVFDATGSFVVAWMGNIVVIAGMLLTLHLSYKLKPHVYEKAMLPLH